ncbi:hypothetical protein LINPERPRIM_LOCUS25973 [Linum perenne]
MGLTLLPRRFRAPDHG